MNAKQRLAILLLVLLPVLWACGAGEEEGEQVHGSPVYFLSPGAKARGGDLIASSLEPLPEGVPLKRAARAVVERLLEGPVQGDLESPLPGVELLSVDVRDRRAYVDLSGSANRLSGVDLALADYCLTLSLTELEGISAVSVTAEGRPIGQQPKQVFYERDVLLSSMDNVLPVEVTLYFLNSDGALAGEQRILELYEGQTLAESVMAALLEGPRSRELTRLLPEDFQVNFVRMENGICYVNLSAASLEALPPDEELQRKMLWSLTDSLYSIASIEELRLLSDGQELSSFGMIPLDSAPARPKG